MSHGFPIVEFTRSPFDLAMLTGTVSRRSFLRSSVLSALATTLSRPAFSIESSSAPSDSLEVHLFSKHLQFLDYEEMCDQAARMGFAGLDLTVRPGGHVEPAEATRQLPRVGTALARAGLAPVMFTSALTRADSAHAEATLASAAEVGFRQVRLGWPKFPEGIAPDQGIESLRASVAELAQLLAKHGLRGAFQNHAGRGYVGASIWELHLLLKDIPRDLIGIQYDIRHATVERGISWEQEFALAAPNIATLAVKDFRWAQSNETSRGQLVNTPIGEGWVDFDRYFELLRKHQVQAPTSMHLEYPLGGAEHGQRELTIPAQHVYDAMSRDLAALRELHEPGPMQGLLAPAR